MTVLNSTNGWRTTLTTIVGLLALIWLSGCGQKDSSPYLEIYCPTAPAYSDNFNSQLADEVEALPRSATAIPKTLGDYARLRDTLRRCDKIRSEL